MAHRFVVLAQDAPPLEPEQSLQNLMEIENRMVEGIFSVGDSWALEQMSGPSGMNLPQLPQRPV
jgi:hypothetical protein